jgi:hypothetical protein
MELVELMEDRTYPLVNTILLGSGLRRAQSRSA